jgi:hypothetical protein
MRPRIASKPDIPMPVQVSLEVEGEAEPVTGWIARLSLVGVDIDTVGAPPVGRRVSFFAALDPTSSEILGFAGRIQWVTGTRVGVQFTQLGAKETHAIMEAMRRTDEDAAHSGTRRVQT